MKTVKCVIIIYKIIIILICKSRAAVMWTSETDTRRGEGIARVKNEERSAAAGAGGEKITVYNYYYYHHRIGNIIYVS